MRCTVPSDLVALAAVIETWADHLSLLLMVTPRLGMGSYQPVPALHHRRHIFSGVDSVFLCEMVTILHLEGLNSICQ